MAERLREQAELTEAIKIQTDAEHKRTLQLVQELQTMRNSPDVLARWVCVMWCHVMSHHVVRVTSPVISLMATLPVLLCDCRPVSTRT